MVSARMVLLSHAGGVALSLSLACGGGGGGYGGSSAPPPPPPTPAFLRVAALNGASEVPAIVTTAQATGQVTVDPTTLAIIGSAVSSGIAGTQAHIHEGAVGVAGPVVIPLTGGTGGVWVIAPGTVLTSAQYASLQAGNLYFNIHSAAHGAGEIRGQIQLVTQFASLTGSQESAANSSTATGIGVLSVNPATGDAFGGILTQGITGTDSHVHSGAVGVSGPVILPLTSSGGGTWTLPGGSLLTAAQVATFQTGGLYGNVHSAAFPAGEIRGQFNLASSLIRSTTLSGANEVPANASAATGKGTFALDPITLAFRGGVVVSGVVGTQAHVHAGAAGASGAANIPLTLDSDGSWIVPAGTFLTADQFNLLRTGGLYVNVHSTAFPDGEIRGQIPADAAVSGGGGTGGGGAGGGGY